MVLCAMKERVDSSAQIIADCDVRGKIKIVTGRHWASPKKGRAPFQLLAEKAGRHQNGAGRPAL